MNKSPCYLISPGGKGSFFVFAHDAQDVSIFTAPLQARVT
jgi:hypothetical protein